MSEELKLYISHLVSLAQEHSPATIAGTVHKLSATERKLFFRSVGE